MTILITFLSVVSPIAITFLLSTQQPAWLVAIGAAITGFSVIPIMAVAIDFAAELTYPIEPQISSGLLFAFGGAFGIIMTLSCLSAIDSIEGPDGSSVGLLMTAAFDVIALIMSLFIKQDLRRMNFE